MKNVAIIISEYLNSSHVRQQDDREAVIKNVKKFVRSPVHGLRLTAEEWQRVDKEIERLIV